jgi:hypothetical protein
MCAQAAVVDDYPMQGRVRASLPMKTTDCAYGCTWVHAAASNFLSRRIGCSFPYFQTRRWILDIDEKLQHDLNQGMQDPGLGVFLVAAMYDSQNPRTMTGSTVLMFFYSRCILGLERRPAPRCIQCQVYCTIVPG